MKARLPTKIARAAHSPLRVNLLFNRSEALASYNKIPPININSRTDRKRTRLNSSHSQISYPVFCLEKKRYYAGVEVVLDTLGLIDGTFDDDRDPVPATVHELGVDRLELLKDGTLEVYFRVDHAGAF